MKHKYSVAGYVKLAKLWERKRTEAIAYHKEYFKEKFEDSNDYILVDVYVDITGAKDTYNRTEMLRLMVDIFNHKINCIYLPTRAYLVANIGEFCYLIYFIFNLNNELEIITEDVEYNINTIEDKEQKEAITTMAEAVVLADTKNYRKWEERVLLGMNDIANERSN